jgi:hypothetical protein
MLTGAGQRMQAPVSVLRRAGQRIKPYRSAYARAGQRITDLLDASRWSLSRSVIAIAMLLSSYVVWQFAVVPHPRCAGIARERCIRSQQP